MPGEKGFMLKRNIYFEAEQEKNLVSVRQETIEKKDGILEIRSHHKFDTEQEAKDFAKNFPDTGVQVTTKKQADKALKAKVKEAKKKQANTGKRHGVINGETVEMQVADQRLIDDMETLGEVGGMDAEIKLHLDKREALIEANREMYEEMKSDIEQIRRISDFGERYFNMKGYFDKHVVGDSAKQELFGEFFQKEYSELYSELNRQKKLEKEMKKKK